MYEPKLMQCNDTRKCFAKKKKRNVCLCDILGRNARTWDNDGTHYTTHRFAAYKDGQCPFCKPKMDVTNGVKYPVGDAYLASWDYVSKARSLKARRERGEEIKRGRPPKQSTVQG